VDDDLDSVLVAVGPRLRALRRQRETTLVNLSATTGISVSTLSRLESSQRRPTLELLLPVLGDQDLVLAPGEAAEFDTRVPHWFASADTVPVEVLSLFGRQGERAHLRARSLP
jgi:transcriptional regulator with XRE-family HTH domain